MRPRELSQINTLQQYRPPCSNCGAHVACLHRPSAGERPRPTYVPVRIVRTIRPHRRPIEIVTRVRQLAPDALGEALDPRSSDFALVVPFEFRKVRHPQQSQARFTAGAGRAARPRLGRWLP